MSYVYTHREEFSDIALQIDVEIRSGRALEHLDLVRFHREVRKALETFRTAISQGRRSGDVVLARVIDTASGYPRMGVAAVWSASPLWWAVHGEWWMSPIGGGISSA